MFCLFYDYRTQVKNLCGYMNVLSVAYSSRNRMIRLKRILWVSENGHLEVELLDQREDIRCFLCARHYGRYYKPRNDLSLAPATTEFHVLLERL